jgi:hypothetical protein
VSDDSKNGGFVFGDTKETGPNKVLGILPVDAFLTQYTDGASKTCVRIVFKIPGHDGVHILKDQIQGALVVTQGTSWFKKAFNDKLKGQQEGESSGVEPV